MEKVVLVTAMAYLCVGHAYRLIYDYGGYTLDVTGYVIKILSFTKGDYLNCLDFIWQTYDVEHSKVEQSCFWD